MSSIALVHSDELKIDERKFIIDKMNQYARHRGRAETMVYHDDDVSIGFNQHIKEDIPAPNAQDYAVALDGIIYNKDEIAEKLSLPKGRSHVESDVEILYRAYEKWGVDCMKDFNGVWSFVLYDKKNREIIAARDKVGTKPLYYIHKDGLLAIASEIKQLLPFTSGEIEDETAFNYFNRGYTDYNQLTLFREIKMLRPSEYLKYKVSNWQLEIENYYIFGQKGEESEEEELEDLLQSSVSFRKCAPASLALTLSSGLDSNILAYLLKTERDQKSFAYTSSFPWWRGDESKLAEKSAAYFKMGFFRQETYWNDLHDQLGKLSYIHDCPLPGYASYASFKLYEQISDYRIRNSMNGQGLDELFGGYDTYFIRYLAHLLKRNPGRAISEAYHAILLRQFNYRSLFRRGMHYKSRAAKEWLVDTFHFERSIPEHDKLPFLGEIGFQAIYGYSLSPMLHSVDRNSQYHGVQSHSPFLDYRLIKYALNLPDKFKIREGKRKYILREKFKDKLPPHVLTKHKKQGYGTPQDFLIERDKEVILSQIRDLKNYLPDWVDGKLLLKSKDLATDSKLLWRVWAWVRWREFVKGVGN